MTEKNIISFPICISGWMNPSKKKEREKLFVDFLYGIKNDCSELFILGDLFDYWFEYDGNVQKGYYRLFTALNDLVENGTKIHYAIGNHDFMHSRSDGTHPASDRPPGSTLLVPATTSKR